MLIQPSIRIFLKLFSQSEKGISVFVYWLVLTNEHPITAANEGRGHWNCGDMIGAKEAFLIGSYMGLEQRCWFQNEAAGSTCCGGLCLFYSGDWHFSIFVFEWIKAMLFYFYVVVLRMQNILCLYAGASGYRHFRVDGRRSGQIVIFLKAPTAAVCIYIYSDICVLYLQTFIHNT